MRRCVGTKPTFERLWSGSKKLGYRFRTEASAWQAREQAIDMALKFDPRPEHFLPWWCPANMLHNINERIVQILRMRGLLLAAWLTVSLAAVQNIEGDWHASLEVKDDAPLRLALHVTREESGALKATLDSIDEAGSALPVDSMAVSGDTVKFEMKDTGGFFEGRITAGGSSIAGSWKQDGDTWPLNWERGEDPAVAARPLDPKEAREKGRACAEWFYGGKVSELWAQLSPVMQQALVTADKIREFRVKAQQQLGSEIKIIEETVKPEGSLQVYRRLAKFDRATGNVDLQFVFNARGMISGFVIRPVAE